ncbi:gliding motility-associated C-terminal domain-containing protein [Chitinophaga sp. GCM10012297]|uniref:Gliding motility-associated C-terminal domain-containing protein n=1 Tax=Chitinophaga chungangae TaxID=2821488 RepID=A0ABS3YFK4_9BACT|nr:gliding motility-associated C-terminal domain-containing protein [Chitinophaga chungangae]MBO9153098.1 gliding motility-associated C-terminal domain-containing protein [Chitinophaga chungangae]
MSFNVTPKCLLRALIVFSAFWLSSWPVTGARAAANAAPTAFTQYWWYPAQVSGTPEYPYGRSPLTTAGSSTFKANAFFAAGPIYSAGASDQEIKPSILLCPLCAINNDGLSHDGDPNTAAEVNATLGILANVGQRIIFPGTYEAGDTVVVDFAVPSTVVDLSLLGGIRLAAFNGTSTTPVLDVPLNSPLINVQALGVGAGGKQRAKVAIPAQFDRVEVTIGAVLNTLSNLLIYEVTAMVPVTITPSGTPVISPAGSSAALTASMRLGAATFEWFDAPTGGTSLGTGATFNTPVLTRGVHTYYVSATTTADDKDSYLRTAVTVDVGGGPGLLWTYGDQQASPRLSGICALCTVVDPLNAVDADPNTSSLLSAPVGALSSVGQLIQFPGIYQAGDSIVLDLELPGQLYTKSILTNITIQPYLGAATSGPATDLGTDLINVQLLGIGIGGTNKFRVSIPATAPFDGVQVNLNAVLAELAALRIYEAAAMIPVAVTPSPAQIPYNTSASLNATVRPSGATINWYATPTGGSPLQTGAAFNTPQLTRSTTYYVEASTPDGLTSYLRTAVTVTLGGADGPLWSYGDTEQSPQLSGICAGCSVQNPELAIDHDTTTASNISIPLGVLSSAGQLIRFPGNYQALDSIILDLAIPAGQLLNAQLLSGIRVETFNGATPNNDAASFSTALANAQLLGISVGPTGKFRVALPATAPFDAVQVSLTPVVGGLANLQVFEATAMVPVTVSPAEQTVPAGTTASITAGNRLSGAIFNWYTSSTGGSPVGSGATFTTPPMSRRTVYYVEASTPDGLTSFSRTPAAVNVGGGPGPLWTYGDRQAGAVITGVCLNCTVTDGDNAVDEDTATSSLITTTVGALGSVSQLIHFPGTYQAGDSVAFDLELPDQLFSLQALSGLTVQSYTGNTPNGDAVTLDNNLVRIEPLGLGVGTTGKFRVILPVNNAFDGVSIGTNSALSALGNLRVYEAVAFMPVTVTPPAPVIPSGTTATMTASVRAPGATYAWYDARTGGTLLGSTADFTTPPLTRSKEYYVEASTPDGKKSFVRTAVPVTVGGGPGPLWTYGDNQQSPVIGGVCLGCIVQSPDLAVDGDTTTASQAIITVGALGSVGQIIKFPGTYQAGDSISFTLGVPAQVLSAQLLSGIRVQTFNGTTPNNDAIMLDNDLINLQALGLDVTGNVSKFRVTVPVNAGFDGAQVDLTGLVSALGSLNIYEAAAFIPVTVMPPSATVPFGHDTTFIASIRLPDATFSWYDTPTGGTPLFTGTAFNTPVLIADKTYYVEAATPDGLKSYIRTAVPVTVTVGPASPDLSCGRGVTQSGSTFGLCLLCSIQDSTMAVDDNAQTSSSIHVPVGLLGAGAYQRFQFGNPSAPGDSLRIVVGSTTGLLNLQLLGNVTIRPRNNGVENAADVRPLNNGLLTLQLLDGGSRQVISFAPSAIFDEVEIRIAGVASALTEINIFYVQQITPRATAASDTVNVCSGTPAVLNASGPAGATFRWYDAPTGGTLLFTGATFTTPAVTADGVYYLEAASAGSTCPSEVRSPVFVKVGLPTVTVTANSVTIPQGGTATFNVNTPDTALTYNWYSAPAGGTPLFTGPSFTTPPLNATTTFYVEASNSDGCVSAQRIAVIANVVITDPDAPCDIATTQVSNANGICLGCYVDNQNSAADASTTTFSSMHVIAGLLGGYVQQTLIFTGASDADDSVRMLISFPSSLADVGLLGSLQLATYNGTTYNNDRTDLNGGLLSLKLLPGNTQALVSFAPSAIFDRVELRMNSGVATALSAVNVHYAQRFVPVPDLQVDTVSTCPGSTATLAVAPRPNTVFRWYSTPTGGTPLFTGTSFESGPVSSDTAFYVEAVKTSTNCANPVRTIGVVNIDSVPAAPTLESTAVTTCSGGSATLRATAPAGATFRWYDTPTGGTAIFTGAAFVTPALDSSVVYYAETVSSGGCASATRTAVQVDVTARPGTPDVTPNGTSICAGNMATLTASSATPGVTFNWYASAALDSIIFSGPVFTTPALNTTTTYFVTAANGQCQSATPRSVTVQVNAAAIQPTVSMLPAGGIIEYGQTATLTATSGTAGATYRWFLDSLGTVPVFTGAQYVTPQLATTTKYFVEAVAPSGCASMRASITVRVNRNFNPGCDFANAQTFNINGICLLCAVTDADNAVDTDTTNFANIQLPVGVGGSVSYFFDFGTLAAAGDTAKIRFATPAGLLDAAALSNIRVTSYNGATSNNDTRTLSSSALRVVLLGGGNQQVVLFAPGAAYTRIEIKLSGLVGALLNMNLYYANRVLASPAVTASATTLCAGGQATLTATASDSATVRWYNVPTGGTPLFTGKVYTTGNITATTTYYAESYRASTNCVNPIRTPVTISVLPVPDAPVIISGDTSICTGGVAILQARTVDPAHSIRWFDAASGGVALSLDSVFTTPALSANKTYYAEAYNGACGSLTRVPVTVTVGTQPTDPVLESNNLTICSGNTAELKVTSSTAGLTIRWYTVQAGGTPVATGATFVTPVLSSTTIYYVEAVNNTGGCINPGGRLQATVNVNATPAVPVLLDSVTSICRNQPATLSVRNPQPGVTYNWYDAATGGTLRYTGASITTAALTDTATFFVEAAGTGNCASTSRAVAAVSVVTLLPAPTVESANVSVCRGSQAVLRISSPQAGVTYNWYDAPGGNLLFTGPVYTTGVAVSNATYHVEAVGSGGCASAGLTQVNVTVTDAPALPVIVGSTTVCQGSPISLSIQNPVATITYNWYNVATGGTRLAQGATFAPTGVTTTTTYYVEAVNGSCTSAGRTSVTVTVNPAPPAVTVDATAKTVCTGNSAELHVTNVQAGITYRWYDAATGGTLLASTPDYTSAALTANKDFYVEAVNASNCVSTGRTKITVTVVSGPTPPTVESTSVAVCRNAQATLRVTNAVAGNTYNWYDAPGGTLLFTGTVFTTPAATAPADYYVEAISAGNCGSTTLTKVEVTITEPPAVPVVGGTTTICLGAPVTLTITSPQTGLTYNWYSAATGGTPLAQGTSFAPSGVTATTTYYVEAAAGACTSTSRTTVTVTVNPVPPSVTVEASTKSVCAGNQATLNVTNVQPGLTYRWYDVPTGGTALASTPTYTTSAITANKDFYVEAVNTSNCASATRTRVSVTITNGPALPAVAASVTVCRGNRATSSIINPRTDLQYRWYDAPIGGTLLFTGSMYTSNPLSARDTVYVEAMAAGGTCTSNGRSQVILIASDAPGTPVLTDGGAVTICTGSTATFTVQNPLPNTTYRWYDAAVNGNLLQDNASPTFTTPALTANLDVYVEAVIGGGCASAGRAKATATVGNIPQPPVVNADAGTVCPDSTATLRATSAQAGVTFTWYTTATGGNAIFTGPVFTTPALTAATTYYVAAGFSGGCVSATRTPVTINIYAVLPAPTVSVANRTANSITFTWNAIAGALGYRVSTDGGVTFTQPSSGLTGTTHTVTNLQPNQVVTLQVMAVGASECANSAWFQGGGGTDNPAGNLIFVPNAFTPNNDGTNDILYVYGTTIATLEMRIYNQWGQQVFETKDKGRGWDGTMSGKKQPIGVYNYALRASLQDGTTVQKRGTITIIR